MAAVLTQASRPPIQMVCQTVSTVPPIARASNPTTSPAIYSPVRWELTIMPGPSGSRPIQDITANSNSGSSRYTAG